ncbi:MAG: hypothetical protein R2867_45705 [Caldilineaceae bacterium]
MRAYDIAKHTTLVGKRCLGGIRTLGGIWQTVWLEGRTSHMRSGWSPMWLTRRSPLSCKCRWQQPVSTIQVRSHDNAFSTVEVKRALLAGSQPVHFTVNVPSPQLVCRSPPFMRLMSNSNRQVAV